MIDSEFIVKSGSDRPRRPRRAIRSILEEVANDNNLISTSKYCPHRTFPSKIKTVRTVVEDRVQYRRNKT